MASQDTTYGTLLLGSLCALQGLGRCLEHPLPFGLWGPAPRYDHEAEREVRFNTESTTHKGEANYGYLAADTVQFLYQGTVGFCLLTEGVFRHENRGVGSVTFEINFFW